MRFWSDQFRESKDGKFSSKKLWGFIIMFLVCISFVLDGIAFYTANENMFNSMLIAGTTLLGLRLVGKMFSKKDSNDTE
jgi:uncharacterized membrane protein YwaF